MISNTWTPQLARKSLLKSLCTIVIIACSLSGQSQSIQQWYDDAQERIDTLRRGSFGIEIYDADGQPYTGPVKVTMSKHEFPFGIAFDFYEGEIQTEVPTETQWRKAAMYKYFNYGVSGNSFKWSGIDPNGNGPNWTNFEHALNWTQKVGWELRAHTLLWGGSEGDNHAMPQWVTQLGTAEEVFEECKDRVQREVARYKGLVKEYDVINEPLHATYTQELYGDSLNWKSFEWAYEADPDAELFVNEYNVEYGWGDADEYRELIQDMLDRGTPVKGIGMQAHFWECCRPNITEFVTQINKLASLGLPIKLTEFDYAGDISEAEQASDFIKVLKIAFSHPSINGMISWALADVGAWRENTGYFDDDFRPKLAADTLLYYTKELWSTNFEETITGGEELAFDAYYGDYNIEVQFGDEIKEFTIPLTKANEDSVFQLFENEASLKPLDLVNANLTALRKVELTFDQALDPSTLNKYDFRLFTSNDATVINLEVSESDDSVLVFTVDRDISLTDYVTVSYFPGSLQGVNGAVTRAFGIEEVKIGPELNQPPTASDRTFELSANASNGKLIGVIVASDPEGGPVSYEIVAGNDLGIFSINSGTGVIRLANDSNIDIDETPVHELTIEISDGVKTSQITVTINLVLILGNDSQKIPLQIYPNPSSGNLNVVSRLAIDHLEIYNIGGKKVFERAYENPLFSDELFLDVKPGIYLLKIMVEGSVQTSKVYIKE